MRRPSVGPLALLAASLFPAAGAFAIDTARVGVIGVALELLTLGWLVRDLRTTLLRAAFGLVAAFGIALTTYLYGGRDLETTAAAALRILYLVLPSALVLPLVRPSELGDHLAQRLRLPPRLVVASVAALQRIDSLADQWRQIQRTRRSRGLGLEGGPVRRVRASAGSAFALLVIAMRQAGQLAMAMDARGFAGARRRTWAAPAPWHAGDTMVTGIAVFLGLLPWLLKMTCRSWPAGHKCERRAMHERGGRRRVSFVGALALAVVVAGCGADSTDESESEPMIGVGDCFAEDASEPVPCSTAHEAQTIYVSDAAPRPGTAALTPCRAAQAAFLGQDFNSRLDVRLWVAADETWYRCDLVLRNSTRAGSGYEQLHQSLEGAFRTGVPLYLRACLDATYDPLLDQDYVSCAEPHRSRELPMAPAIGTLDEPFPGDVSERAIGACNATAAGAKVLGKGRTVQAFYPENAEAWDSGERTADCWVSTSRGRLPAVSPRG